MLIGCPVPANPYNGHRDPQRVKANPSKEPPMPKAKKLKCNLCGKSFSMAAHLGRHKSTIHAGKKKAAKKKAAKKKVAKNGRRKAARKKAGARRPGRPPAIATRFGLKDLPIDELAALIKAAQQEADRRLREFRALLAK